MKIPSSLRLGPWSLPTRHRRPASLQRPSGYKPHLEALEAREVLSGSPPVVLISGAAQVAEAPYGTYTLSLTAVDPENDSVTQWSINWGDGSTTMHDGSTRIATHAYASGPAVRNITATAVVGGETFTAQVSGAGVALDPASDPYISGDAMGQFVFGPDFNGDSVGDVYAILNNASVVAYDGASGAFLQTLTTADEQRTTRSIALGPDGNLYFSNTLAHTVFCYDFTTSSTREYISSGTGLYGPLGLTFGPDGRLYVQDGSPTTGARISRYDEGTQTLETFISNMPTDSYYNIEFGSNGYFYAQAISKGLYRYDATTGAGGTTPFIANTGQNRYGFTRGPDGDIYISDWHTDAMHRFDGATGSAREAYIQGGGLDQPYEVTFGPDANGDGQLDLYVGGWASDAIHRYSGPLTATASTSLPVTVLDMVTQTYNSPNVPKQIKDTQSVTSTLTVGDAGTVFDINVRVNITHQRDEDLDVFLVAPDGTRVELFTDVGGLGQNFTNTVLDDEASAAVTAGSAPFTGTYRPEGLLSALDGKSVTGTWTLEITDDRKSKTGTLNSWSLTILRGVGPAALEAAEAGSGTATTTLSEAQLQPLVGEVLARWQAAGVDTSGLVGLSIRIADLGGTTLGMATGDTIWLDDDAAGWGWFVDPTPWDDGEFTTPGDQGEQNRIDLLSVLMHEMGHVLGHDHEDDGVMAEALAAGTRLSPASFGISLSGSDTPGTALVDQVFRGFRGYEFDLDAVAVSILAEVANPRRC